MVMTILEAHVPQENWSALERAFSQAVKRMVEPGLVQTFLAQSSKDASLWRIMTVWSSRAALEAMRSTGETPRGLLIFKEAGAEPTLSVFDLRQQITKE